MGWQLWIHCHHQPLWCAKKFKNSISEQVSNSRWATQSSDCRYYHYHSLTHFCAGKQLCEFKGASTQHISKLDIPVQRGKKKTIAAIFHGLSHFPLTSNSPSWEQRAERCLMMPSMSLQVHVCAEDSPDQDDIRAVMQKPLDIMAGLILWSGTEPEPFGLKPVSKVSTLSTFHIRQHLFSNLWGELCCKDQLY